MGRKGRYHVAEIFYSLQGEGHRKGTVNVFVRFAGCNLQCNVAEHGFDCDTDFRSRETFANAEDLVDRMLSVWSAGSTHNCYANPSCRSQLPSVILTGGEPTLQVDDALISVLKRERFYIAIETNGTQPVHRGIDWVTCSPKTKELAIERCDEVKCVLAMGEHPGDFKLPKADHYFLS
ncbi:hypothetical protein LCGC14_1665560, partial [marine sediment metagenome]